MKFAACLLLSVGVLAGCGSNGPDSPTKPSAVAAAVPSSLSALISPLAAFPGDRAEVYQFRVQLEDVYRTEGYPTSPTVVNMEGAVIWITEYVRYRVTGCSHEDAINKVNFGIDNLNSPALPGCGLTVPFPERGEAYRFRTEYLEPKYRAKGFSTQSLFVNPEGDVIWTMEYLRLRVGDCSHAETTNRVNVAVRTKTTPADCTSGSSTPTPPPQTGSAPVARFDVVPNQGTQVNAPQCSVRATGGNNNRNQLLCTFDATSSTPRPGITSYEWDIDGQDSQTARSGERLQNTTLQCGSFGDPSEVGKATDKTVRLTVRSPGGTNTVPKSVTFVKSAPC